MTMSNRTVLSFSSSSPSSIDDSEPSFYSSNSSSEKTEYPSIPVDSTTSALIRLIEQLKSELNKVKEAKTQLTTLYKVKCKSDLDKSAQLSKLRLQLESEFKRFCTIDQKDFVAYLQRQILQRDQRIAELNYQLEGNSTKTLLGKKIESIEILQTTKSNRRLYDEDERALQRENILLRERLNKLEGTSPSNDSIKRALSKQAEQFQRQLKAKDDEITRLISSTLRQSNIEKLHLEKRLLSSSSSETTTNGGTRTMTSSSSPRFTSFIRDVRPSTRSLHQTFSQPASDVSPSSIDPANYHALQKSNEVLKSEVHRLASAVEENTTKLNLKLKQYDQLQQAYEQLSDQRDQTSIRNDYERQIEDLRKFLRSNEEKIVSLQDELQTLTNVNNQLRTELKTCQNTNERLEEQTEKLRSALTSKNDEFEFKQRENEQLKSKNIDLENIIQSLKSVNDVQKQINHDHEINQELWKRKQDDFEQFQRMHDATKREHQETIRQLQEKISDLEQKTELQAIKHQQILREFEALKSRPSLIDDSAPIPSTRILKNDPIDEKSAQIVRAKYHYEPLKSSPNEHPEIELPLNVGEFYLIYGEIDEDGFYDGRNLDGHYGLIPSNFVEFIANPQDLPEHVRISIEKLKKKTSSRREIVSNPIENEVFIPKSSRTVVHHSSSSDVSSDDRSQGKHIPPPTNLHIEKLLTNSVLIAWEPALTDMPILGYQILLDHSLYNTIQSTERTRALIENLQLNERTFRLSVRTMTSRGLSHEQQCTLLISKSSDAASTPTDLRVDRIRQTSAVVSWWPASNDLTHRLLINDVELQTLQPGIYRFKLSGLTPNSLHKVTIKTKSINSTGASIEFRTTSFDESVEPPRRVQVAPGSQANSFLISWEPLLTSSVALRGYRIFIDGRLMQEVNNPLSDHTILNVDPIRQYRTLTIRTVTEKNSESADSTSIDLERLSKDKTSPMKTLIRPVLESPSTISSSSTEIPQIDLKNTSSTSPEPIVEPKSRLFVAIYDYDPKAMSPNADNDEELPFKKGEILKIIGEQDPDGFYLGQTDDGRRGFVPSNMVTELVAKATSKEPENVPKKKMIALYDYNPTTNSPNANVEDELSFRTGDFIFVHGSMHDDGFYDGELENGRRGLVPSNYLKEATANVEQEEEEEEDEEEDEEEKPVVTESKKDEEKVPLKSNEPDKPGLFDRFKNTFSWNFNEPI